MAKVGSRDSFRPQTLASVYEDAEESSYSSVKKLVSAKPPPLVVYVTGLRSRKKQIGYWSVQKSQLLLGCFIKKRVFFPSSYIDPSNYRKSVNFRVTGIKGHGLFC